MPALKVRPRKMKVSYFVCPTCGRDHKEDEEFGRFCCASCLQTVIRPLIVGIIEAGNQAAFAVAEAIRSGKVRT